ncbi:Transporter associated domain protein [compost metagenome]
MDVLTAVAGDLPEHQEDHSEALQLSDGSWLLDGRLAVGEAARLLEAPALADDYPDATLAGCLLRAGGRIPETGDAIAWRDWRFEVTRREGLRIDQVRASPIEQGAVQAG